MLTTNQKGAIAETAIAHEAVKLGIGVLKPVSDMRYDLVFDTGRALMRVQCKWASRDGDVIIARLYAARRVRDGLIRTYYGAGEIDAFAIYCLDLDRCYLIDIAEVTPSHQLMLRLRPPRNNQQARINWAKDYEFGARLGNLPGP